MARNPAMEMKGTALRLFRGLAHSYDRTVDFATLFQDRYWKTWVARRAGVRDGGLALDIGCGTLLMEERVRNWRCRFVGLDLTEEMLRGGQSKGLPNVDMLLRGDAESLPFADGKFDLIIGCYVAKYVSIRRLAGELSRVARPGAKVVLYDFVKPRGPLAPFLQIYVQAGLRAVGLLLELAGEDAAFTFRRLPAIVDGSVWDGDVAVLMERSGFETVAVERLTGGVVFAYCGRRREDL